MLRKTLASLKARIWAAHLPKLVAKNERAGDPYDYYAVYFADVERNRYQLMGFNGSDVSMRCLNPSGAAANSDISFPVARLAAMESEIVSYKKYGKITFANVFGYFVNCYLPIFNLKTALLRGKAAVVSAFFREREVRSQDRIYLLGLIVNEFVHQRPSRLSSGITVDEVIDILYGKLWYQHIRNEQFRRKVTLLMASLVLSGELAVENNVYRVQGNAIATLVEHEKDERRAKQQDKIQRNMVRLMLIITAATVLITLALLGLAGVIDLHKIWQDILQIKPVRFLFKLI